MDKLNAKAISKNGLCQNLSPKISRQRTALIYTIIRSAPETLIYCLQKFEIESNEKQETETTKDYRFRV